MLLGIPGALRAESTNRKLVREAARLYGGPYVEANIRMPLFDEDLEVAEGIPPEAQRLFDQIVAAEAVVISSPEYNKSIPGGLKNALDWVSRIKGAPWADKPLALIGAAAGREGGARAGYALRLAMTPFRPRMLTGPEVHVAQSGKEFDAEGRLLNEMNLKSLGLLMEALKAEARRGTEALSRTA
jgi:chromate reductase, NAD(P)H dehydrogenase (quinone)